MREEYSFSNVPLPPDTVRVTGRFWRPSLRNGRVSLVIALVAEGGADPLAAGLMSIGMPDPPPAMPGSIGGVSLFAGARGNIRHERGWLLFADEFTFALSLDEPGRLKARLTGSAPIIGEESEIELARSDFRSLSFGCWNGEFAISDLRFETR